VLESISRVLSKDGEEKPGSSTSEGGGTGKDYWPGGKKRSLRHWEGGPWDEKNDSNPRMLIRRANTNGKYLRTSPRTRQIKREGEPLSAILFPENRNLYDKISTEKTGYLHLGMKGKRLGSRRRGEGKILRERRGKRAGRFATFA